MEVKYLGTAAAERWPGLFCLCEHCEKARMLGGKDIRTRSQVIIDRTLLIDFPSDTYMHLISERLDLSKVTSLVITHSHMDHFYPQDLLLRRPPFAHLNDMPPLHVYGNACVTQMINDIIKIPAEEDIIGSVIPHELQWFKPVEFDGVRLTPLAAEHMKSEQAMIYIIEKGGKTILYGNDTGYFAEETWERLAGRRFDLVNLDCTGGPIYNKGYHMDLVNNRMVKERMLEMGSADAATIFVSTHFSHNGGLTHAELVQETAKFGAICAYDGMTLNI